MLRGASLTRNYGRHCVVNGGQRNTVPASCQLRQQRFISSNLEQKRGNNHEKVQDFPSFSKVQSQFNFSANLGVSEKALKERALRVYPYRTNHHRRSKGIPYRKIGQNHATLGEKESPKNIEVLGVEVTEDVVTTKRIPQTVYSEHKSRGFSQVNGLESQPVEAPVRVPIPQLKHELEDVLTSPGPHLLQEFHKKKFNFSPFLHQIHQPDTIDYAALPRFISSSNDQVLRGLALRHDAQFVGSTSSMTGLLSQLHFLFSRRDTVDSSSLYAFSKPLSFTPATRKPASVIVRPSRDGVWAIDSDKSPFPPSNQLLLDLGKSMEKMLTLTPRSFARSLLKKHSPPPDILPEAYNYLKVDRLLLRSQLDCYSPHTPGPKKVFDLKTRAVVPVRLSLERNQQEAYRLERLLGKSRSFEREYRDMLRSVFIKYSLQARIGRMGGMFMTYHNTFQVFGFEYISVDEIDKAVFGSTTMSDLSFSHCTEILQRILDTALAVADPNKAFRLLLHTYNKHEGSVFVEVLDNDTGFDEDAPIDMNDPLPVSETVYKFKLQIHTFVNGELIEDKAVIQPEDNVQVMYSIEQSNLQGTALKEEFLAKLKRAHLLQEQDIQQHLDKMLMNEQRSTLKSLGSIMEKSTQKFPKPNKSKEGENSAFFDLDRLFN